MITGFDFLYKFLKPQQLHRSRFFVFLFVCFFALFLIASNFCSCFCRAAQAFQVACIMDSGQKEDSRNIYLLTFSAVSNQTQWYYDCMSAYVG